MFGGDDDESSSSHDEGSSGPKNAGKTFLILVLILMIPIIVVAGYAFITSEGGQVTVQKGLDVWDQINPFEAYGDILSESQTLDVWDTKTNRSSSKKGIELVSMDSISGETIPAGNDFEVIYNIEFHEIDKGGVPDTEFFCELQDRKDNLVAYGEVLPSEYLTLQKTDFLTCRISGQDTADLDDSYSVAGWFEFPFETNDVTLKVYFTSGEVYDELIEDDVDFFKKYDIDEDLPLRATYNGEPLRIAIGVTASGQEEQPVVVRSGRASYPVLGIHLENEWQGEVMDLEDIEVYLPAGVEINEELSQNPSTSCPFQKMGTSEGRTLYAMDQSTKDMMFKSLIDADIPVFGETEYTENERNFQCWLDINEGFIGSSIYKIDEYSVSASYRYRVDDRSAQVYIRGFNEELVT